MQWFGFTTGFLAIQSGGSLVVITGTNFTPVTAVNFGLSRATSYTIDIPASAVGIVRLGDVNPTTNGR